MKKFNKKKLPSRHTSLGPDKAPQRSFYYAMDLTEKDVAKPFVGVVSTWNEAAPCNIALMRQAQSVKKGVHQAGGTPREFCTITVTDGIAMGHEGMKSSLISRDVIADSTELTVRGHCYDALVGVAGCDKSLPGLMMAMVRLNVPSVFIYGGSILPGRFNGKDVTVVDVFEGVGKFSSGKMSAHALRKLELKACPSAGACGGQFTANTMACVSEAIGLALPYSAGTPAPYTQRDSYALKSGKAVMITPHNYAPQYDQSSKSGKYCVQFIIFKRNESENVRKWWETKCLEWCYQRVEENKFGDQKYLDQFPLKFKKYVHILEKKQYIQAPWNARIFESKDCLIYHFHGLRLIENKLGLILFSKGYKIPQGTLSNIYQIYFCELRKLYQKGLFEWIGQTKEINKLVALSKELIFFMFLPIKIFRKPVLPRINYFKINNLT